MYAEDPRQRPIKPKSRPEITLPCPTGKDGAMPIPDLDDSITLPRRDRDAVLVGSIVAVKWSPTMELGMILLSLPPLVLASMLSLEHSFGPA